MSQQTNVSSQFIQGTIPESRNADCAWCQLKDEEIQRLKWLVANMMQSVEDIKEFEDDK